MHLQISFRSVSLCGKQHHLPQAKHLCWWAPLSSRQWSSRILQLRIGFSGAKRLSRDGKRDDSETPTSMVLCNLRIVPGYFCASGDAHPGVITVDILMCLTPERGPRKQTGYFKGRAGNEQ